MNVTLVTSPRYNHKPITKSLAPIGLASLAAVARQAGHQVHGVEGLMIGSAREIARHVAETSPDVVGTSTVTIDRLAGLETIRQIRRACPKAFVVVGGSHFTNSADDALRVVPEIDAVVLGEGEETFLELLAALPGRDGLGGIKGLAWRGRDGQVVTNPPRDTFPDINRLPMPAWDLFDVGRYSLQMIDQSGTQVAGVVTSRGCPFSCLYCANASRTKVRFMDPALAVDQMMWQKDRYGVTAFDILNDNFMTSKPHVIGLCEEMLRRNCGFTWWCEARAYKLDLDVLKLMKRAGCKCMTFGIETGSDQALKGAHKGLTTADIYQAMEVVAQVGFDQVGAGLIIGLPGETEQTIDESIAFLRRVKQLLGPAWWRKTLIGQLPLIYPGTGLEALAKKEGSLPEDFSWNSPYREPKRYLPLINRRYDTVPHYENPHLPLERLCAHLKAHHWDELLPGRRKRYRTQVFSRLAAMVGLY